MVSVQCVHNTFYVRKRTYSNTIEPILKFPPPDSTSLCGLDLPGNVEKTETSLITESEEIFIDLVIFQCYERRQYNIFDSISKVYAFSQSLKGLAFSSPYRSQRSLLSINMITHNLVPNRGALAVFLQRSPLVCHLVGFWHPIFNTQYSPKDKELHKPYFENT